MGLRAAVFSCSIQLHSRLKAARAGPSLSEGIPAGREHLQEPEFINNHTLTQELVPELEGELTAEGSSRASLGKRPFSAAQQHQGELQNLLCSWQPPPEQIRGLFALTFLKLSHSLHPNTS